MNHEILGVPWCVLQMLGFPPLESLLKEESSGSFGGHQIEEMKGVWEPHRNLSETPSRESRSERNKGWNKINELNYGICINICICRCRCRCIYIYMYLYM